MAVALTREQRDTLRSTALLELSAIGDIPRMLRFGNAEGAQRLRRRLEGIMLLLDDLGWEGLDERERFELTMPREQLEPLLRRFDQEAERALEDGRRELEAVPDRSDPEPSQTLRAIRGQLDEDLDVRSACGFALEALGAEEDA